MAGSSEPAFSFEYKKGAIAPWMITHLFCNSPFFYVVYFFTMGIRLQENASCVKILINE